MYEDVPQRLNRVRERIADAAHRAGRKPEDVRLIAVSKTHPIDAVRAAAAAGQIDFGENKVQEALQKIAQNADTRVRWHLIGHLQSNKARKAAAMSAKAASSGGGGGNADATFNQGIILWNQGKIAEAKAKFEETIKMNAAHPEAHFQLGMALLNEGKLAEAVTEFETYVKISPEGQYATQAKGMIAQLKK